MQRTCECGLPERQCQHPHVIVEDNTGSFCFHGDRVATAEEAQLILDANGTSPDKYRDGMTVDQIDELE